MFDRIVRGYDSPELVVNKDDPCKFLILDENLQQFLFEGMSFLSDRAVCCTPYIVFSIAALLEASTSDFLEPSRTEEKGRAVPRINPAGTR